MVSDFPYLKTALKGKNSFPLGANREVPILKKGTQLKKITACFSSLPLMCVTFSTYWLRHCHCQLKRLLNIGITHVFSCINICRGPRMLFEHEADRPSVQHHPRDPASVNAMKQTCVIVILAYFTLFQPNSHRKCCQNTKLSIFLHWISLNKTASAVYFRTS